MLRVFILRAAHLQTPDDDISDAYCSITYEGKTDVVEFSGRCKQESQERSQNMKLMLREISPPPNPLLFLTAEVIIGKTVSLPSQL